MTLEEHVINFRESFEEKTNEELVQLFNKEVGVKGWVSIRAAYLQALMEVFISRGIDISSVYDRNSTKLDKKVILKDKRLIRIDE